MQSGQRALLVSMSVCQHLCFNMRSQRLLAGTSSHLEQISEQVVTQVLRRHKNQDLAILIELAQDLQKAKEAISLRPNFYELGDVLVHH